MKHRIRCPFALNEGNLLPDVTGLGVTIPTRLGTPYAALSVVALNARLVGKRRREVIALLQQEARNLSEALAGSEAR